MSRRGFTLIELIMVLVLIGIIAVFAAPQLGSLTATKAGAFRDKLRADIRYAQNLAMTRNRRTRVYFNGTGAAPAAGYAVAGDTSGAGDCSAFTTTADPAGAGGLIVALNSGDYAGITVTPTTACLEYDSLGRPYDCSANLGICSATPGGMSVAISPGGSITVSGETGAVN